jgi:hypothetical protein
MIAAVANAVSAMRPIGCVGYLLHPWLFQGCNQASSLMDSGFLGNTQLVDDWYRPK